MLIAVKAHELKVGDVYQNKIIVMVNAPEDSAVVIVELSDEDIKAFDRNAELLVERKVERINYD